MLNDPIVLEIRKRREEYAASLGYDLKRIVADLQSRQGKDGRAVVDRSAIEASFDDVKQEHPKSKAAETPR